MKRFWEIDALRGMAVLGMLVFNWAFALRFLDVATVTNNELFWWLFPRLVAGTFIFLVGVSLSISSRRRERGHFLRRGLGIFALGMLVTLATWLYIGPGYILFGILHFVGLAIMLAPLFFRFGEKNIALGFVLFVLGIYLNSIIIAEPWLLWLGVPPGGFYTIDWFPLLPWLGLVLIGFGMGSSLYSGKRNFKLNDYSGNVIAKCLMLLGRNSLLVYVVHQPMLIVALTLLGLV